MGNVLMIQLRQKRSSILVSSPWRPVRYCYSPSGVKERTGLVSLLLSLLASLLQPWLILGRGIRLPRANAARVTTQRHRRDKEEGKTGRKSSGVRTKWTKEGEKDSKKGQRWVVTRKNGKVRGKNTNIWQKIQTDGTPVNSGNISTYSSNGTEMIEWPIAMMNSKEKK